MKEKKRCEVCEELWEGPEELPDGCSECARMYYPCCNSDEDAVCVECVR